MNMKNATGVLSAGSVAGGGPVRSSVLASLFILFSVLAFGASAPLAGATISTIPINAPLVGNEWRGTQNILWNAVGASSSDLVDIVYRTDAFSTWLVMGQVDATLGTFSWNTTALPNANTYQIQIVDHSTPAVNAISGIFTIDNTDPVTTYAISPVTPNGSNGWYVTVPTITLTCNDGAGSGCFKTYYKWDGAALWTEYTIPFVALEGGEHILSFYSDDQATDAFLGARNEETVQTQTIKVDTAAPTVAVTSLTPPGAYNVPDAINVTLTFSEAVTSAGSLTVALNSGGSCSVPVLTNATTGTCTYTVLAGENSVGLIATLITPSVGVVEDVAGNDSTLIPTSNIPTAPFPIVIDTTAPASFTVGAVSTSGGTIVPNYWNGTNASVHVLVPFANDPSLVGGTVQLQADVGGGYVSFGPPWEILMSYPDTSILFGLSDASLEAIPDFSDGDSVTFTAIITDRADNATTGTQSATALTVDRTAPTVDADSDKTVNALVAQVAAISDSGSGVATYAWTKSVGVGTVLFSNQSGVTTNANTNISVTDVSPAGDGAYTLTLSVTDVAGNSASDTMVFVWDTVLPVLAEVTPVTNPTNNTTPNYTFSSTEAGNITYGGSCLSATTNAVAGSNTISFNAPADALYTNCTIQVTDAATNMSIALDVSDFEIDTQVANVSSITTTDADLDGRVDTATIVFTDEMKDSTFVAGDFTIGGIPATTFTSGAPNDNTIVLSHAGVAGTEAKTVAYVPGTVTDLAGNIRTAFTSGSIDAAKPVLLSARTTSVTTLTATFSEDLNESTVNGTGSQFTVAGFVVSAASETSAGVVTLTVATMPTDATPVVTYISDGPLNDLAPVPNAAVTLVWVTAVDGVAPVLTAVSISSNNDGDLIAPEWAKAGDVVTLTFTSSEAIATPAALIQGVATAISGSGTNWTAFRTMTVTDNPQGTLTFMIGFADVATPQNSGTSVTATIGSSSVFFDRTAPEVNAGSDKEVNAVVSQGATATDAAPSSVILSYLWTNQTPGVGTITFSNPSGTDTNVDTNISASADGTYTLRLTVTDNAGNVTSDEMTLIWDTVAPELLTHSPAVSAIGVLVGASTATVTFNEDIVLVNAGKVLLVNNSTSASYKGTVAVAEGDGNSAVLNIPYNGLNFGTMYRINVFGSAVRDVAGNIALQTVLTSFFTTEADTIVPVIDSLSAGSITMTGATLSATTNESATCRYAATDSAYAGMIAMTTTGGTSHSQEITGLTASTPYTYFVRCQDASGNTMTTSGVASFTTATATDTTKPVITLLGMNPISLTVGDTFTDPGATANDNVDGNITIGIVVGGDTVDTDTAGTYIVTYDVSDSAVVPNAAVQEKRYVIVVDPAVTPVTPTVALNEAAIVSAYTVAEATARFASGLQFDTTNAASVTVNGSSVIPAATITAATQASAITLGAHTYNVIVTSSTGHTANITVSYQVNADPVVQGNGELAVTGIYAVRSFATADNTFENGWKWTFRVTVPTSETQFAMKFLDFVSGSNTLPAATNIRYYTAQSSTASTTANAVTIAGANAYPASITLDSDADASTAGRQIEVTVEVRVPISTQGGSYSTSYGVQSE